MSYELYEQVCKERFEKLEKGQDDIKKDVGAIREKIFNGMSNRIEANTKLILLILTGVVLSIIVPIIRSLF